MRRRSAPTPRPPRRHPPAATLTVLVLGILSVLGLTGCRDTTDPAAPATGSEERPADGATEGGTPRAEATTPSGDAAQTPTEAASTAGPSPGEAPLRRVEVPAIPTVRLPDLGELDRAGEQITAALEELALPIGDVEILGERCDGDRGPADDVFALASGTYVVGDATVVVHDDGSGSLRSPEVSIVVESDGSGRYRAGSVTIVTESDGSGVYRDATAGTVVTVESNGSGSWRGPGGVIRIDGDGSGRYRSADEVIVNDGDGSGSWVGAHGVLEIDGDGTGTLAGAPVSVEPLTPLAPVDRFPSLGRLAPVGEICATVVRLSDRLLFGFDDAAIAPDAASVLGRLGETLASLEGIEIAVVGHTDGIGEPGYNLALSRRRAEAVAEALRDAGVTAPLSVEGRGESEPIAAEIAPDGTDDPAGRQANRRVEIVVRAIPD